MNPYLKRIRWRLIWISFFCLTLALGAFALNQWVYAGSDDQCSWQVENGKIVIREILPEGVAEEYGLLEGDELLKIQGRAYEATQEGTQKAQRFINGKSEGTILLYTVKRQGRQIVLPIRLVKPLDYFQIALLANGLLAWAISLLVVFSAPERKSSRHFFYLAAAALLLSSASVTGNPPVPLAIAIALMTSLAAALLPPLWIHFFLRFPHPNELRKNRRFLRMIYGTFAIMALLLFLLRLWVLANGGILKTPAGTPPAGLLKSVLFVLSFLPITLYVTCLLYTSPSPRDGLLS